MATHKSAKKRIQRNEKHRVINQMRMSRVKTALRKFQDGLGEQVDTETLQGLLKTAQSELTRAASKGILHINNVSRRIGRLTNSFKKAVDEAAKGPTTEAKAPEKKKKATTKKAASKKKTTSTKKKSKKKASKKKSSKKK